MNYIKLTEKLISIPSYVDEQTDERDLGKFIYQYLKEFPWLDVEKQIVGNGRFNVIAKDRGKTNMLVIGHMDTVQPQNGWSGAACRPNKRDGKIYGLGASDMKGALSCLLSAIRKVGPTSGCGYLFYIDEEYEFKGIKKFIKAYKNKFNPEIIISADGSDLRFGTACRGLIEVKFQVYGESGHAANPKSGKNAIVATTKALNDLERSLRNFSSRALGKSSMNVAYIYGGQSKEGSDSLGKEGNVIANYCECVVDIRPAKLELSAEAVIKLFIKAINKSGCSLKTEIKHDLGSWETDAKEVEKYTNLVVKPKYVEARERGYVDVQMLWEAFGKVPCLTYGPGENKVAHKPNEYVSIKALGQTEKYFMDIISMYNQEE